MTILSEVNNSANTLARLAEHHDRRRFLWRMGLGGAAFLLPHFFTVPGAFAAELALTPDLGEGPFYPDKLPLDTDNDLIIINDSTTPAVGVVTYLTGRVLNAHGDPVKNALVEIWQADNNGAYLHSKTFNADKRDSHFQGYGRFETSSNGEFMFRTIKPVAYPGRTPHIHFAIKAPRWDRFTTQCFVEGEPKNDTDGILQGVKDPAIRKMVILLFSPMPHSKLNELNAHVDVVLGLTPEEKDGF